MFTIEIPTFEKPENLDLERGCITFVMGANGTGKSALLGLIAQQNLNQVERIYAHRNITFDSSSVSMQGTQRDQYYQNQRSIFSQPDTRFKNPYATQTVNMDLYNLYVANSAFIATQWNKLKKFKSDKLIDEEKRKEHDKIIAERSHFERLETILNGAGLPFSFRDKEGKILTEQRGSSPYGIQELSDGERAAFLLSASVITAKSNSLILIDEPERHLHRSISSPLISSLLQDREDCTFVISTHDIGLSLDHQPSQCILLRQFQHPDKWSFDCIKDAEEIDEGIAEAVLGARKTILFVEGGRNSLDFSLYELLYPEVSIRAVGSCNQVIQATRGLNKVNRHHWVRTIGIIDKDRRSDEKIKKLKEDDIICLPVHDVEALYYNTSVIEIVAERLSKAGSINPTQVLPEINSIIIDGFSRNKDSLINKAIVRYINSEMFSRLSKIKNLDEIEFEIKDFISEDIQRVLANEEQKFDELIDERDISGLCASYPIKETGILDQVARCLRLDCRRSYENIVREAVITEKEVAKEIRNILEPLTEKLCMQEE